MKKPDFRQLCHVCKRHQRYTKQVVKLVQPTHSWLKLDFFVLLNDINGLLYLIVTNSNIEG